MTLVSGERRWRAARLALESGETCQPEGYDLFTIPALVLSLESGTARLEKQLVENLAREVMPSLDTACALLQALSDMGLSKNAGETFGT